MLSIVKHEKKFYNLGAIYVLKSRDPNRGLVKVKKYTWRFRHHFLKGDNFCNQAVDSLIVESFQNGGYS